MAYPLTTLSGAIVASFTFLLTRSCVPSRGLSSLWADGNSLQIPRDEGICSIFQTAKNVFTCLVDIMLFHNELLANVTLMH
jgi:hypothetical protein